MQALCGMPHEDVEWHLVFDLEQCAGACCRGHRKQVEVVVELAWQVKPERPEHEREEVVAVEAGSQTRSRSERFGKHLPVESRSP